jgi:hypothetical protein
MNASFIVEQRVGGSTNIGSTAGSRPRFGLSQQRKKQGAKDSQGYRGFSQRSHRGAPDSLPPSHSVGRIGEAGTWNAHSRPDTVRVGVQRRAGPSEGQTGQALR